MNDGNRAREVSADRTAQVDGPSEDSSDDPRSEPAAVSPSPIPQRGSLWGVIATACAAGASALRAYRFSSGGRFNLPSVTAVALVVGGVAAWLLARRWRRGRVIAGTAPPAPSPWREWRLWLWLPLGLALPYLTGPFWKMFAEFGVELPQLTLWLLSPYMPHLVLAIGWGFLIAAQLATRPATRSRVVTASAIGQLLVAVLIPVALLLPLVRLLNALA